MWLCQGEMLYQPVSVSQGGAPFHRSVTSCSDHGDEPCDKMADNEDAEGTNESSSDEFDDEEVVGDS